MSDQREGGLSEWWPLRRLSVPLSLSDDEFDAQLQRMVGAAGPPMARTISSHLSSERKVLRERISQIVGALGRELQQLPGTDATKASLQDLHDSLAASLGGSGLSMTRLADSFAAIGEVHQGSPLALAPTVPVIASSLQKAADAFAGSLGPELSDSEQATSLLGSTEMRRIAWLPKRALGPRWHWYSFFALVVATYAFIVSAGVYFDTETTLEIVATGSFAVTVLFEYMLERIVARTELMDRGADGRPFWSVHYVVAFLWRRKRAAIRGKPLDPELTRDVVQHLVRWVLLTPAMALALLGVYAAFVRGDHRKRTADAQEVSAAFQKKMTSLADAFEIQARSLFICSQPAHRGVGDCPKTVDPVLTALEGKRSDTTAAILALGCAPEAPLAPVVINEAFCRSGEIDGEARKDAGAHGTSWFLDAYESTVARVAAIAFRYENLVYLAAAHEEAREIHEFIQENNLREMSANVEAILGSVGRLPSSKNAKAAPGGTLRQLVDSSAKGTIADQLLQHRKALAGLVGQWYAKPPESSSIADLTEDLSEETKSISDHFAAGADGGRLQPKPDDGTLRARVDAHKDQLRGVLQHLHGPPPEKWTLVDIGAGLETAVDGVAREFDANNPQLPAVQRDGGSILARVTSHRWDLESVLTTVSGPAPSPSASVADITSLLETSVSDVSSMFNASPNMTPAPPTKASIVHRLQETKSAVDSSVLALGGQTCNGLVDGSEKLTSDTRAIAVLIHGAPDGGTPAKTDGSSLQGAIEQARQDIGKLCKP